jgi:two-component system chemotaxis response regulator CheB
MMHPGRDIITIGASAGGVEALRRLVGRLPADLPASVFIVLHLWPEAPSSLAPILTRAAALRVREAKNEDSIERGVIYLAPNDRHLMVEKDRLVVVHGPRENRARPAINPLFRSAAAAYGPRVVGVILTGMLDDGAAGLWAVKRCGGIAVVQDPADAQFSEMPANAIASVAVDHQVPLDKLPAVLVRLAHEPVQLPATSPNIASIDASNAGMKMNPQQEQMDRIGQRTMFTCPECNGALWEIDAGGQPEYRCHVGHTYSPRILATEQNVVFEQSLWSAIRALKESAAMDERLASRSAELGLDKAGHSHRINATEKHAQVESLMGFFQRLKTTALPPVSS